MTNNTSKTLLWITRTAIFIALIIVTQLALKGPGPLYVGSIVNFILVAAAVTGGLYIGLTVALLSPWLAAIFGILPAGQLLFIPVICLGNLAIVAIYWLLVGRKTSGYKNFLMWGAALVAGAVVKFGIIYLGNSVLIMPLLNLAEKVQKAASTAFGIQQLFTALIGGVAAAVLVPLIQRALKKSN